MVSSLCLSETPKKKQSSSILNPISNVVEINLHSSFNYPIFTLFVLNIVFWFDLENIGFLRNIYFFEASISLHFLTIFSKSICLLNHSLRLIKNEHKNAMNQNQIAQKNCSNFNEATISIIINILFLFFFVCTLKQQDKPRPNKNSKNAQTLPLLNRNNYIWRIRLGCENEIIDQGRSYSHMSIQISDCFFSRSSQYSGDGGIIYASNSSYSINVNYSMFYNCACSFEGGAIWFSSSNSYLRMICANRCSCGSSYHYNFASLRGSQANQLEYLSVSNCSHTTSGYYPIFIYSGNQRADNLNSSMNNAIQGSGVFFDLPLSFTSSHCTFSNNKASNSRCLYFSSNTGTMSMSYANIVHNNSPSQYGIVLVEGLGYKMMKFSIFQNNQNFLFYIYSGSLDVFHSFIDHSSSSISNHNALSTTNNSFTNIMTYRIQFFNSLHCIADIPLIDRTPIQTIEESPMRSIEETPYRSYVDCILTCHMAHWREISLIISFSLITLDF